MTWARRRREAEIARRKSRVDESKLNFIKQNGQFGAIEVFKPH
jgi:hypothetical protein